MVAARTPAGNSVRSSRTRTRRRSGPTSKAASSSGPNLSLGGTLRTRNPFSPSERYRDVRPTDGDWPAGETDPLPRRGSRIAEEISRRLRYRGDQIPKSLDDPLGGPDEIVEFCGTKHGAHDRYCTPTDGPNRWRRAWSRSGASFVCVRRLRLRPLDEGPASVR